MNSRDLARFLILGGVIAGLSAGTSLRADVTNANPLTNNGIHAAQPMSNTSTKTADKHACKGLNSCKSMGNCKSGDNGCAGKNSCKGKGGCASKAYHHDCAGKNACKGQGPGGKNACKGKGSCAVPPKAS